MKHNNKKILSIMLTLCMVLSLFSGTAVAANATGGGTERNITLDLTGDSITDTNGTTIVADENGVYTCQAEGWTWDSTNSTLTLDNCRIETTSGNGIVFPDNADAKLVLNGENNVSAAGNYAIIGSADNYTLTISGSGSLEAKTSKILVSYGNLILNSGTVDLVASSSEYVGVQVKNNLTVNGGTLRAVGFKNGAIYSYSGKVAINGGHVTISVVSGSAIAGTNDITVDSKLTIVGGDSAEGAKSITSIGSEKYLDITAPAAATFTDGFGNTINNADTYVKDTTPHSTKKDYTFAGWFDSIGKELTDVNAAESGTSYTAKWTKNGKTVRTMPLDLTGKITDTTGKEITADNTGLYKCDEEGWNWRPNNLTLNGVTIDVDVQGAAVTLPTDAIIAKPAGSQNTIINTNTEEGSSGIKAVGAVTIVDEGALNVSGGNYGLEAGGSIDIKGPITASCVNTNGKAIYAKGTGDVKAAFNPQTLYIEEPENGSGVQSSSSSETEFYFTNSDGKTPATKVVIAKINTPTPSAGTLDFTDTEEAWKNDCTNTRDTLWMHKSGDWSWDTKTKTLTLSNARIEVDAPNVPVIKLPDGATIITTGNTSNKVINNGDNGYGIQGEGVLTVQGAGMLTANGYTSGIFAKGLLTINAPIYANNVAQDGAAIISSVDIKIDPSLYIANGDVVRTENRATISGNPVEIAKKTSGGDDEQTYTISGTVKKKTSADDTTGNAVQGATVELKKAGEDKAIDTKQTDASGKYSFADVPNGVYNIIVTTTDGQTMTKLIKVSGANKADIINITLPKDKVSSVVEVKGSTQPVLVGGLDQVAEAEKNVDTTRATSIKVVMTVESQSKDTVADDDKKNIEAKAYSQTLDYLNIELKKFIGDDATGTTISNTETNVLEIIVPYDMTGKNNITVYRHHGSSAEAFTATTPEATKQDGTYYLDKDNNLIHIFTNKFSTYAIGYNTSSGSSSGGSYIVQKPEVTTNTGGKTELSTNGTTVTITPDAGYEIESVLLNGKDMGKVNKLTGLKTGDKVVVTFQKKSEEPTVDTKTIVDKVSKMKLTARSSKTTKKNIKITVKTDKETNNLIKEIKDLGYTVKYKYYRSTKKASKYTARIEKDADINSYINTFGKKGTRYYYRVKVMVYDADGNFIAKSDLKQCKYAARIWSK